MSNSETADYVFQAIQGLVSLAPVPGLPLIVMTVQEVWSSFAFASISRTHAVYSSPPDLQSRSEYQPPPVSRVNHLSFRADIRYITGRNARTF